jgi:hypothetical protein
MAVSTAGFLERGAHVALRQDCAELSNDQRYRRSLLHELFAGSTHELWGVAYTFQWNPAAKFSVTANIRYISHSPNT